MEVKLLRSDINEALNNPDEVTRLSDFWVVAEEYDECFPFFKEILTNKNIDEIKSKECTIIRHENGFLVKDPYGDQANFTTDEISLFIDLWAKAQKVVPNVIYLPPII